jgi:hypothetical protein
MNTPSNHGSYGAFCHGEFTVTESPSFVCAWDDVVEIHTLESLHAKYDETNLFDPADWTHGYRQRWPALTPKWTSHGAELDMILAGMEVGDEWSSDNFHVIRIK